MLSILLHTITHCEKLTDDHEVTEAYYFPHLNERVLILLK